MKRLEKLPPATPLALIKDFWQKAKDFVSPEMLVPAFAGAPGYATPSIQDLKALDQYAKFETCSPPLRDTPSRKIMEWQAIDILEPNEPERDGAISYEKAQKEVDKLMHAHHASHEFLSYEAAKLCSEYPEVAKYTFHIMVGAFAEDFVFMPEEGLDHLHASALKKEKLPKGIRWAVQESQKNIPTIRSAFRMISRFWKKHRHSFEEDFLNRPYFAHFYDPTKISGQEGMSLFYSNVIFESALHRILRYWEFSSAHYIENDKPRAFCGLGHLIHLIQDLHVPAHVHDDIHGSSIFAGKIDSLEDWCMRADHPHIARPKKNENIRIWDSGPLAPPKSDPLLLSGDYEGWLKSFVGSFVKQAQRFRSVGAFGTADTQKKIGKLTDEECYAQASELIPLAISNSAKLIAGFIDYHKHSR